MKAGEKSVFVDVRDSIAREIKAMPMIWSNMAQADQDEILERIDKQAMDITQKAIDKIAGEGFPEIVGFVDGISIKSGIKATLKFNENMENKHQFIDHEGKKIKILLIDEEVFTSGEGEVKSEPDNQEMEV